LAFATIEDIEARRTLSADEKVAAEALLEAAQSVVEEVIERDEAAIIALKGAVPAVLKFMTVEKVLRALVNPSGLSSQSEALGSFSHTERFNTATVTSDLLLSELEERLVRRAVYGRSTATAHVGSLASDICTICQLAPTLCDGFWVCGCEVEGS